MITQLATVKARLAIPDTDPQYDALLLRAIEAVGARFDQETKRTLARTVAAQYEFQGGDTEICVPCYPIETVTRFELKSSESEGWLEQPGVAYLIRQNCIISLSVPLNPQLSTLNPPAGRVTYTGGFLLSGSAEVPSAAHLPADLEQAAIEQTAFWFQTRDKIGVLRQWPVAGNYEQFADLDLLPNVRAILERYRRWTA